MTPNLRHDHSTACDAIRTAAGRAPPPARRRARGAPPTGSSALARPPPCQPRGSGAIGAGARNIKPFLEGDGCASVTGQRPSAPVAQKWRRSSGPRFSEDSASRRPCTRQPLAEDRVAAAPGPHRASGCIHPRSRATVENPTPTDWRIERRIDHANRHHPASSRPSHESGAKRGSGIPDDIRTRQAWRTP